MNFTIEECIEELNFVGTIAPNHKPCFYSKTTIDKDAWFVTFKRRWNGEKGEYGIIRLKKILSSCDIHYRMCVVVGDLTTLRLLMESLRISLKGFNHLIQTYDDQINVKQDYTKCSLQVKALIKNIDAYLGKHRLESVIFDYF